MLSKIVVLSILAHVKANQCNISHSFYDDLGCKLVRTSATTCLQEYDCHHMRVRPENNCFLRGKYYNPLENIETKFTRENCMYDSWCGKDGSLRFLPPNCQQNHIKLPSGCFRSYSAMAGIFCCPDRLFCPHENITATCTMDGLTFKEGTMFFPRNDPCTSCRCESGFRGVIEKPFCKKIGCRAGNIYHENFMKGCAPVYERGQCCVNKFRCPAPDDVIVRHPTKTFVSGGSSGKESEARCRYGMQVLNIGDIVDSGSSKMTCQCVAPPLVTCVPEKNYKFY